MRPTGRDEHDSLYFTYPQFEAPAALPGGDVRHRVVIVGAGPVGMTAALVLAREGVPSVVLDRKKTYNDGSRAICVARQSFYILSRIGLERPFTDKALGWTTGHSYYRGRKVLEFHMPHDADQRFMPMYNIQQQYIEQFLHEAVAAHPLIDMRWDSEVESIAQDGDGVSLQVRDGRRSYRLDAAWALAADGARSAVRQMMGLRLQGQNHEGRYVIADIRMRHDFPTIRRALFDSPSRPGGTVLIHRQPDDIWRIDYQLGKDESAEEAILEDNVRASVTAVLRDIGHEDPWELEWWSIYSANTLALDDYRSGRVFFVGDSAHIVPIFGVRGLNNGLADAENIAWKLALVERGLAAPDLLDSYSPERRGATLDVFDNATRSTRFMTPPTHGWRTMRDAALSLALDRDFTREFINPRQMTPYTYSQSPLSDGEDAGFADGPVVGSVIREAKLPDGSFLTDRIGADFTLLVFGESEWAGALAKERPEITVLRIGAGGLPDPDGRIAGAYGARDGSAYLIRPDMHVAARWLDAVRGRVEAALDRFTTAAQEKVA